MQQGHSGWKFIYDRWLLASVFLVPPPRAQLKEESSRLSGKSVSTKWRQMCYDLLIFFFFHYLGEALCQVGLKPVRASSRRCPVESRPTTPNALKEANCCMRSLRFLGSSALCSEEQWGRIWIIHPFPGHRWKIHFCLLPFFPPFCSFISGIIA